MEENKQSQDTESSESTDTGAENTEDTNSQEETTDYKAEAAKWKAIAERKDKKLQKESEQSEETKKPKTDTSDLTREEVIFYAKGGNEENLELAKKIAAVEGIGILAAMEDPIYQAKVAEREEEQAAKKNSLGGSGGSNTTGGHEQKPLGEMTREEHEAHFNKYVGKG